MLSGKGAGPGGASSPKSSKRPAGIDTKYVGTSSAEKAAVGPNFSSGGSQPSSAANKSGRDSDNNNDPTTPLMLSPPALSSPVLTGSTLPTSLMDRVRKAFRTPPTIQPASSSSSAAVAQMPMSGGSGNNNRGLTTTLEGDESELQLQNPAMLSGGSGYAASASSGGQGSGRTGSGGASSVSPFALSPPTTGSSSTAAAAQSQALYAPIPNKIQQKRRTPSGSPLQAAGYSSLDQPDSAKAYPLPLHLDPRSPGGNRRAETATTADSHMTISHASVPPPTTSRKALKLLQGQSLRETRPLALLPMLRTLTGYRFMLAFLYSQREEVPLLAWKSCEIFAHYASLAALTKFWEGYLSDEAPHPLPLEIVPLDRREVICNYLLEIHGGCNPPAVVGGFPHILDGIQGSLLSYLACTHALFKTTPLWQSYVTGAAPPLELRRVCDEIAAEGAEARAQAAALLNGGNGENGTNGDSAIPDAPTLESRAQRIGRVEAIENILAESMMLTEWKPDQPATAGSHNNNGAGRVSKSNISGRPSLSMQKSSPSPSLRSRVVITASPAMAPMTLAAPTARSPFLASPEPIEEVAQESDEMHFRLSVDGGICS